MPDRISLSAIKFVGFNFRNTTISANTTYTGANTNITGGTLLVTSNTVFSGANQSFNTRSSTTLYRNRVNLNGANTNVRGGTFMVQSNTVFSGNTVTVAGTFVASQGAPIKNLFPNTYTLTTADNGRYFRVANSTSAVTITVPLNSAQAFPLGAEMAFIRTGSNTTSAFFTQTSGVTLNVQAGKRKLTGQYAGATLKKVAINTWDLSGNLTA